MRHEEGAQHDTRQAQASFEYVNKKVMAVAYLGGVESPHPLPARGRNPHVLLTPILGKYVQREKNKLRRIAPCGANYKAVNTLRPDTRGVTHCLLKICRTPFLCTSTIADTA